MLTNTLARLARPALAAFAAVTLGATLAAAPALAKTIAPKPAPDFTLPQRGATAPVNLAKLKGQVVMINFWASWCGPCRQEFPILDEMYKKYRPMGFTLLAVNVEPDPKDADRFLAKTPASFPILLDARNELSKLYDVNAMPTTVLVDRKGNLRWVHRGYKPGDENEYLNELRKLLREK